MDTQAKRHANLDSHSGATAIDRNPRFATLQERNGLLFGTADRSAPFDASFPIPLKTMGLGTLRNHD